MAMAMQHTSGPWEASVSIRDSGGWKQPTQHVQITSDQILIADYDTAFVEYPSDQECEANARLIAAAPDMLEALNDLVNQILDYERVNNLAPQPGRKFCWGATERAVAAIEKAQG